MAVNYRPLWVQLAKKDMKRTDLIPLCGFTTNVVANMGKNKYVKLETIERICKALNCQIGDVVEIGNIVQESDTEVKND